MREDNLLVISLALTFADLDALKPLVTSVSAVGASTIPIPSTARGATAGSAGFLEPAALWASHVIAGGDGCRFRLGKCGRWCADY